MAASAQAIPQAPAFNAPVSFDDPGTVTLRLESARIGLDRFLELATAPGPVGATPLLALGGPFSSLSSTSSLAAAVSLGFAAAGQEFVFRLSNFRPVLGGPSSDLYSQVFSGSSSGFNPQPALYYTRVEWISPTQLRVQFEDLLPEDPALGPLALSAPDLQFLLTLNPVPEPRSWMLLLAGLVAVGGLARRRLASGAA